MLGVLRCFVVVGEREEVFFVSKALFCFLHFFHFWKKNGARTGGMGSSTIALAENLKLETMAQELQSTVVDNNSFPEFCINNVTGKVHNFAYGSNISEVSSFVSKMPAHP
jgi:hypothetical protein